MARPSREDADAEPVATSDSRPTTPPRWERAAARGELTGDGPHAISAGGVELVALRTAGELRVFEGRCPHQGALLGEGELDERALVCRNHRWRFDRESGQRVGGRQCLRRCPTREEDGVLLVDLSTLTPERAAPTAQRTLDDLPGPRGLPWLGSALSVDIDHLHTQLEAMGRTYGEVYTLRLGRQRMLVTSNSALAETVSRSRPDLYRRLSVVEDVFTEMGIAGVFSAEGDAWRAQRRLAMGALAQRHLRGFYPTLSLVAARLVRRWEAAADAGRELDLADELKRFTVDVTTQLAFGHDMNTLEKDDDVIQRHLELVFPALQRRLNAVIPYWRWFRLPADRRLDRALAAVRSWIVELVATTRRRLETGDPTRGAEPTNFLEAMLLARDADGQPFSDDVIFGNTLTMLLAGEDTTAYTVAWAVHHLCDDAAATAALREEIDATLGELPLPRDAEQAATLAYATAVANEAMRLRPVAPFAFHEPIHDVVLGDVRVPKGTPIVTLSRPAVLAEATFRDPLTFAPERWLAGWEGAHDAAASIPFGSGPRICPGRSLAILEMRVLLAAIYRSFHVERVGHAEDVKEISAFTMMPVGLRVRLRRR
ncbi:MAG: cytochrome P450 [Labilithrix sp.]|nr:cytochrome P450 [Labilithrix sp.]MBX3213414.1 cytochrome P450 [Labilithrix sp.]